MIYKMVSIAFRNTSLTIHPISPDNFDGVLNAELLTLDVVIYAI